MLIILTVYKAGQRINQFEGQTPEVFDLAHEWVVERYCEERGLSLPMNIETYKAPYFGFNAFQIVGATHELFGKDEELLEEGGA